MSTIFPDCLHINAAIYKIDVHPLEDYLVLLPVQPPRRVTPFTSTGYVATWEIHEGIMYLVEITSEPHAALFSRMPRPVAASWYSGFIHGRRGNHRYTGYPPRKFCDDEIVLEINAGIVMREWLLDLRAVPDQSNAEQRQSLPSFLLKST
ncbi:hypothetical protein OU994_07350 [Pseudoduganella sp. SL102]|uniref:hypothetical protein n=1 Tax=Pseudoduganella sp. SL102 TaxID=2995154 RepID=UPI00248C3936|nr:hypothetical protein [Pseudoduganella sp. SL102]WBS04092.1 hypothetical protein OU994_07350 [Pseudoduganella sp. SL102]